MCPKKACSTGARFHPWRVSLPDILRSAHCTMTLSSSTRRLKLRALFRKVWNRRRRTRSRRQACRSGRHTFFDFKIVENPKMFSIDLIFERFRHFLNFKKIKIVDSTFFLSKKRYAAVPVFQVLSEVREELLLLISENE